MIAALVNPPTAPPVHRARLLVTSHLLHELLLMPDTMQIVGVALHEGDPRTIVVLVDDPALAAVAEGEALPQVEPVFLSRAAGLVQAEWPMAGRRYEGGVSLVGDVFPGDDG